MKNIFLIFVALCISASFLSAEPSQEGSGNNIRINNNAFEPGEKLTYSVSWSKIVDAGVATMQVNAAKTPEGSPAYELISQTNTIGFVDKIFPVKDSVESLVDAEDFWSIRFQLRESHGSRKRERDMVFDRSKQTVTITKNGETEVFSVPERVQDALSSLYYVRMREDFTPDKPIVVDVHDNGKTWSIEVQTVGKEHIKTPLGEFNTIKIKTFPKYEGVFMNKGEIHIWLTDDARKIPVLMKSKISIGSIVATLINIQGGKQYHDSK